MDKQGLDRGFLTLAPRNYNGVGASSAEIRDALQFCLESGVTPVVTTGHYGDLGFFYQELDCRDVRILVGQERGGNNYPIPDSPGGIMVYVALRHAAQREEFLNDVGSSLLSGFSNDSWEAAGAARAPKAEEIRGLPARLDAAVADRDRALNENARLREAIAYAAKRILATKSVMKSSTLAPASASRWRTRCNSSVKNRNGATSIL